MDLPLEGGPSRSVVLPFGLGVEKMMNWLGSVVFSLNPSLLLTGTSTPFMSLRILWPVVCGLRHTKLCVCGGAQYGQIIIELCALSEVIIDHNGPQTP